MLTAFSPIRLISALWIALSALLAGTVVAQEVKPTWSAVGWGGGGYYYGAAYHPTRDGVIYLCGDVAGVYRSDDHGKRWKFINHGLAGYGVFSLAVDRSTPDTVYAATTGGLCKSTDMGETWHLLPETGPKQLRLTGEKGKSIRSVAVDPTNSNVVYVATPVGKIYKSTDGGQTWALSYQKPVAPEEVDTLRVQYGKNNGDAFGGFWTPFALPADAKTADCVGVGFTFAGDGSRPRDLFMTLTIQGGGKYRSKNLNDIFADRALRDLIFKAGDFTIDPEYASKNAAEAAKLPSTPDWGAVTRMDLAAVGALAGEAYVGRLGKLYFAMTTKGTEQPTLLTIRDFKAGKTLQTYGNIRAGATAAGAAFSVVISEKEPSLVLAATSGGLLISRDAGATWTPGTATPASASNAVVSASDSNIVYASFFGDGIWKSSDRGQTWQDLSAALPKKLSITEVAINPQDANDVYAIGRIDWGGQVLRSTDGGGTWQATASMKVDPGNATTHGVNDGTTPLSVPTNITLNPKNPKEFYVSANWRPAWSDDGGKTLIERVAGADISCITDIRFHGGRAYVSVMDEGVFSSESDGEPWKQLWPLKYAADVTGHFWRLSIADLPGGKTQVVSTGSPWVPNQPNLVVRSDDNGATFAITREGLPTYRNNINTMWGMSYPRALAADPKNPNVLYMGMDGDATTGKTGGGIFKSTDGGRSWLQLPNQPGSRRMFYGLAVDPTDSNRIYWGATGKDGGVYVSEDAGASWKHVFKQEGWIFNLITAHDGAVYAAGNQLWRSTDQGKTWKAITSLKDGGTIVGLEVDPGNSQRIWISTTFWNEESIGHIYRTTDTGKTWEEITGDIAIRKVIVLRYNPATRDLWAGGPGLFRIKQ